MARFDISIKVDTRKMAAMGAAAVGRAEDLLDLTSERIANTARTLAPVDTGALKNSIHVERAPLKRTIADGVEYGVYQEFGHTSRGGRPIPARPFLTPALEQERSAFLACWKKLTE